MSRLVETFLSAPPDQVDPRILTFAKTWRKPLPTIDQCNETNKLIARYPASRLAKKMVHAIHLEVLEAEGIHFDEHTIKISKEA